MNDLDRLRAVPAKQLAFALGDRQALYEPESESEKMWTFVRRPYQLPPLHPPVERAPFRAQPRSLPASVRSTQNVRPSPPTTVTR